MPRLDLTNLPVSADVLALNPHLRDTATRKAPKRSKTTNEATATADSAPELAYWLNLLAPDLPKPVTEHRFHPTRKWRFDYAWPDRKVAVEIDGGQYLPNGGRHNTDADRKKLNMAARLKWHVLRFSTQQMRNDPRGTVALIRETLEG